MPREYEELLKGIGKSLRAHFSTDRKPLSWTIIDRLEKLAETEEQLPQGKLDPPEHATDKRDSG